MEQKYEVLNHILVHLFNDIMKVEEKALAQGPFKELTITDMHTIEAIGFNTSEYVVYSKDLSITLVH